MTTTRRGTRFSVDVAKYDGASVKWHKLTLDSRSLVRVEECRDSYPGTNSAVYVDGEESQLPVAQTAEEVLLIADAARDLRVRVDVAKFDGSVVHWRRVYLAADSVARVEECSDSYQGCAARVYVRGEKTGIPVRQTRDAVDAMLDEDDAVDAVVVARLAPPTGEAHAHDGARAPEDAEVPGEFVVAVRSADGSVADLPRTYATRSAAQQARDAVFASLEFHNPTGITHAFVRDRGSA